MRDGDEVPLHAGSMKRRKKQENVHHDSFKCLVCSAFWNWKTETGGNALGVQDIYV